jgi:hypothetical protein
LLYQLSQLFRVSSHTQNQTFLHRKLVVKGKLLCCLL